MAYSFYLDGDKDRKSISKNNITSSLSNNTIQNTSHLTKVDKHNYWKDRFSKIISFLHGKLHNWYDKDDKYIDVVNDMYEDNVLDDKILKI